MRDSVGKKIIEGLREFTEALENDERITEKFTCRKVTLDLLPVPYSPKTVKTTRKLLMVSQGVFAQFLGVSVKCSFPCAVRWAERTLANCAIRWNRSF